MVAPTNPRGSHDEFERLLEECLHELQARNDAHTAWGLGSFDQWNVDQEVGDLVFSNADGTQAVAPVQIIGSYSTRDNTWLWAWDNPSILEPLKQDAFKVKAYGEQHGIEKLTTRKLNSSEEEAWKLAALAVRLCGAQGAYRGPAGPSYIFMTFGEVELSQRE